MSELKPKGYLIECGEHTEVFCQDQTLEEIEHAWRGAPNLKITALYTQPACTVERQSDKLLAIAGELAKSMHDFMDAVEGILGEK